MNATYHELHEMYRELYDAIPPAHTAPSMQGYWSHIYEQMRDLNAFVERRDAGDLDGAHALLSEVVGRYNAGLPAAQAAVMQGHAAGELAHAAGDEKAREVYAMLEANLFGTHEMPVPSREFGAVEIAAEHSMDME